MKVTFRINSVLSKEQINYPKKTRNLLSRLAIAKEERHAVELAKIYADLGDLFLETEDWAKTIQFAREEVRNAGLLPLSQGLNSQLKANYRLGIACREVQEFDLAIKYQKEQYKIAVKLDDLQEITDALFQLGVSFIAKGESQAGSREDFLTAIDYLKKAERNSKQLRELNSIDKEAYRAQIYMNIGVATMNMNDTDNAIQFIEYAKKIFIRGGDKVQEAQSYANLAVCFDQKNDTRKAIELNRCENAIYEQIADIQGISNALRDLGIRCEKIGLFLDARTAYKKIIENHQLNNEFNKKEEIKWAQDAIKQLDDKEQKAAQIKDLDDQIANASKSGDTREEFRFRGQRGAIYLFINHPKKALFDFEWQRMIAARLQMNSESTRNVLKSLSKAYSIDKQYNEALNCYRELLRDLGTSDMAVRLEIISKIGPILENTSPPYAQLERHYIEYFNIAEQLGDLSHQRSALMGLVGINERYGYADKCRHQKAQLERIEGLLKKSKIETLSDAGSIDSDLFAEDPFDTEKLTQCSHIDNDGQIILSEASSPPVTTSKRCGPALISSQESDAQQWNSPEISKKREKAKIQFLDQSDLSEVSNYNKVDLPPKLKVISEKEKRKTQLESIKNKKKMRKRNLILSSSPLEHRLEPEVISMDDEVLEREGITLHGDDNPSVHSPKRFNTIFEDNDLFFPPPEKDKENEDLDFIGDPLRPEPVPVRKQKIRVIIKNPSQEDETFAIPCSAGPSGTPKTVRWLMDETSRRYKTLYKSKPPIVKLVAKHEGTQESETLFDTDIISDVIESTHKIYAILK